MFTTECDWSILKPKPHCQKKSWPWFKAFAHIKPFVSKRNTRPLTHEHSEAWHLMGREWLANTGTS